jgi:rare lipoprotein A
MRAVLPSLAAVLLACALVPAADAMELSLSLALEQPPASEASPTSKTRSERGHASYYSKRFEGRRTASGRIFRNKELIAAHHSLPFGTLVRVTNLDRGSTVNVRIADRGAFAKSRAGAVIIDLSRAAAEQLRMLGAGRARVLVEVLEWGGRRGESLVDSVNIVGAANAAE